MNPLATVFVLRLLVPHSRTSRPMRRIGTGLAGHCSARDHHIKAPFPRPEGPRPRMASYQYIYVMKGLNKTYPGGREVLKNIYLSFLPGAKIGVLGANGSGKSTLLRIMAGQETEYNGEAWAAEGARVGLL